MNRIAPEADTRQTATAMKTVTYPVVYPESDGQPMADNAKQYHWISYLKSNLDVVFAGQDVFVAGDLLWYPVEEQPKIRMAPDVLVAFDRPKGDRGSYLQWLENDTPPQVVFEILSPGNHPLEMSKKLSFYGQYGVQEYYAYDPDSLEFAVWTRRGDLLWLLDAKETTNWISPRLGIRFVSAPDTELRVFRPDGREFITLVEAEAEFVRAERLAAKLRELGIDPENV